MAQRKAPKEPVRYSEELAEEICTEVANSPYMLEQLCKEKPHWPTAKAIYEWRIKIPEFGEKYARAKQCQIEPLVNHIFTLTRDNTKDFYEDTEGKTHFNSGRANRLRTEVDAIKWLASKLAPKLYGDKLIDGAVGENLIAKIIDKL